MNIQSKESIERSRRAVQRTVDKLSGWCDKWEAEGDALRAKHTRFAVRIMTRDLLGEEQGGCVVAAFDKRYLSDPFRAALEAIDDSGVRP